MALNANIKKEEKSQIHNLNFHLTQLVKYTESKLEERNSNDKSTNQ